MLSMKEKIDKYIASYHILSLDEINLTIEDDEPLTNEEYEYVKAIYESGINIHILYDISQNITSMKSIHSIIYGVDMCFVDIDDVRYCYIHPIINACIDAFRKL